MSSTVRKPATVERGYALLRVKALDAETRTITGVASTPEPDRMGDVIEPLGIEFQNPVPLLLYHDTKRPVGRVKFFPATADGLEFEATLPEVKEPGVLRDRIDEAWQSIKAGLLAGVSIGFRALEFAFMKDGDGMRFIKTEVLELSLVAIPANAGATIQSVKALDMASSGRSHSPGVAGSLPVVRATKDARPMPPTNAEQITGFENTRAARVAELNAIMAKASTDNATLDADDAAKYDEVAAQIEAVDKHLVRLRQAEKFLTSGATRVENVTDDKSGAAARGGHHGEPAHAPRITVKSQAPKGQSFVRYVQALAATRGSKMEAIEFARQWQGSTPEVVEALKAAVAVGTTTDSAWAAPLVSLQPMAGEFLELLRPATILGKIAGLRKVPFNISIASQTLGGTYGWVGQGAPKPVGKLGFAATTLAFAKAAGIIVISQELARFSSPSAEDTIRTDMINGMAAFLDLEFTDPSKAAVANVSPGSITNGLTPITSGGTTADDFVVDFLALIGAVVTANLDPGEVVVLMSALNALTLGTARDAGGNLMFPNLGVKGGSVSGIPVITSQALGAHVIALVPGAILFADDGGVNIDVSTEASVQLDSAPDNPTVAASVMTSLWQNNLVGIRAERFINWKRARTGSVQYFDQTYAIPAPE